MREKKSYFYWGLTAFLTVCALLVFYDAFYQGGTLKNFFSKLLTAMAPILYGCAMAYLLAPIVNWFEKVIENVRNHFNVSKKKVEKSKRGIAVFLTWILVLFVMYLLLYMLIPQLVDSITTLVKNARSYYNKVYYWSDNFLTSHEEIGSWANDLLDEYYTDALSFLTTTVLPWAQQMATNLTGGIWTGIWGVVTLAKNLLIGIIVSVYLLVMKEKSLARCCKLVYAFFKEETADLIMAGTRRVNLIFSGFVRGKLLDSAIIGFICLACCSFLDIPYTPLVSVVIGITNIIPFFGPFIGAIPTAFLILLVSAKQCLVFIVMILILQQIDGNIIGPKILGDSTGISSFWVIVAILVGGGFFGVLGMFVGVPVFACVQELLKYITDGRLRKRNMPTEAYTYVERGLHIKNKK